MSHIFSIAIDGPAGAGKSTVARAVSKALGAMYLDTGAMYRAFGLALHRAGVDLYDAAAVTARVNDVEIDVRFADGVQRISADGDDVTEAIREHAVSEMASAVSAVPAVRVRLVELQRRIAEGHSVVMDGRDIGTVVLPGATLKVFLTASPETRAKRRFDELAAKGEQVDFEKILSDIRDRDYRDSHRAASPLRQAEDAHLVDSSDMTLEEVVTAIRTLAEEACK